MMFSLNYVNYKPMSVEEIKELYKKPNGYELVAEDYGLNDL